MKRQRSEHSSDSDDNHKKQKLHSVTYSTSSSSSESCSEVSDDWEAITGGKMEAASLQQMKRRKVLINDVTQHYEKPNGHLVLKIGDVIHHKCRYCEYSEQICFSYVLFFSL